MEEIDKETEQTCHNDRGSGLCVFNYGIRPIYSRARAEL